MNVLHLTLKKTWFDMILSGEKTEEYREIKPYWINRLLWHEFHSETKCVESLKDAIHFNSESDSAVKPDSVFKHFDIIRFTNGYGKSAPTFDIECKSISIGEGKPEWGGSGQTFIISLGKIISTANLTNKNS